MPTGVDVTRKAIVFVADNMHHRVQYFTLAGFFLGRWGRRGSWNGEFGYPHSLAVSPYGRRVYVADSFNDRVQYFKDTEYTVSPTSVGRVKALFQ